MSKESIEQLIKAEAEKLAATMIGNRPADPVDGLQYVIVRATGAGVHAGYLVEQDRDLVRLRNARRCRRYYSGEVGDCTDLALEGITPGSESQIRPVLASITLTGVHEVIPATEKSRVSIEGWGK